MIEILDVVSGIIFFLSVIGKAWIIIRKIKMRRENEESNCRNDNGDNQG